MCHIVVQNVLLEEDALPDPSDEKSKAGYRTPQSQSKMMCAMAMVFDDPDDGAPYELNKAGTPSAASLTDVSVIPFAVAIVEEGVAPQLGLGHKPTRLTELVYHKISVLQINRNTSRSMQ